MADLMLIGIFILCLATGYLVVKRSGGFVEQIFFKNPKMWYDVRESNEPCRDDGAGNACAQAISRDSGSIGRMPASPEKRSFFGHSTAHKTGRDDGAGNACTQAISRDSGSIGRMPASSEKQSFFGHSTAHKTGRDDGAGNACAQAISRDSGSIGRSNRSSQESDAAPARGPRAKRNMSFFGHSTAQGARDLKAGIKHEWKTN